MDESYIQFFTIKPKWCKEHRWSEFYGECMFMGEAFNTTEIFHIGPIVGHGPQYYTFEVQLIGSCSGSITRTLRFEFTRKEIATKAQRELAAAYTKTGEYAKPIIEESKDD